MVIDSLRLQRLKPEFVKVFVLFLSLSLATASTLASDELTAMGWVQKMSTAMQELSYKGRFVYQHNNQMESMSILHVNDSQGRRERLVSLNGEAREILRDNSNLTCIWPSSRQVVVDQSSKSTQSPFWIPEDVQRLGKYYEFKVLGKDRIADHPAVIVSIQPMDQFRYGMKVWIHEKNGLLLQSNLFNEHNEATEQVMFTELSLLHYDDEKTFSVLPKIANGYALIRSHSGEMSNQLPADNNWQFQAIPVGFWIESAFRKKMANASDYTQQVILTDGMASVSVFIEKMEGQYLSGESSMGAVNAFGTEHRDHTITAIGEVPAITVKQIATSAVYIN